MSGSSTIGGASVFGTEGSQFEPGLPGQLSLPYTLCTNRDCKRVNPEPRWKLCPKCRAWFQNYHSKRVKAQVKSGRCVQCREPRGKGSTKTLCAGCAKWARERSKNYYVSRNNRRRKQPLDTTQQTV